MSVLSLIQYIIKEYFVYVMAAYTLVFIVAVTLFVKYRGNRRRAANVQAVPERARTNRKPVASITGNKLIFADSRTLQPLATEFLEVLSGSADIFIVTQVFLAC